MLLFDYVLNIATDALPSSVRLLSNLVCKFMVDGNTHSNIYRATLEVPHFFPFCTLLIKTYYKKYSNSSDSE